MGRGNRYPTLRFRVKLEDLYYIDVFVYSIVMNVSYGQKLYKVRQTDMCVCVCVCVT